MGSMMNGVLIEQNKHPVSIMNTMGSKQTNTVSRLRCGVAPCQSCLCREPWWSWSPWGSSSGAVRSPCLPTMRTRRKRRWWRRRRSVGVPAGRVTARPAGALIVPSLWVSTEKQSRHQRKQADCFWQVFFSFSFLEMLFIICGWLLFNKLSKDDHNILCWNQWGLSYMIDQRRCRSHRFIFLLL